MGGAGDARIKSPYNAPDRLFKFKVYLVISHIPFSSHLQRPADGLHIVNRWDDEFG
jgi:hypothetical protein